MTPIVVSGAAAWSAGRWLGDADAAGAAANDSSSVTSHRPPLDVSAYASAPRIARADRLTKLVAMVAARALPSHDPSSVESRSVIVASALASAHTNEAFELRRMRSGRPVPRDFPYTAPNAAAGELASALRARGPSLALVGGMEAGLAAIERSCRWLRDGACIRVILVAAECPPDTPALLAPYDVPPVECAAALVLECAASGELPRIDAAWEPHRDNPAPWHPMLSVAPVADLVAAWLDRKPAQVRCVPAAGSAIRVTLRC